MPVRSCVVCRTRRDQANLWRVHLDATGTLVLNAPASGRSAYCCQTAACANGLTEKGRLERTFRQQVGSDQKERLRVKLLELAG